MNKSPATPESKKKRKNRLEWVVFGLSAAGLIGVISVLVHQSITVGEDPAYLLVRMGTPLVSSDQVRIPVSVRNEGDEPAIAVEVEISGDIGGITHSCSLQIDYVPHRSSRSGWASFPGGDVPVNLSARVVAYMDP